MMFLCFIAEKLHRSIEEVMQFSVQELKIWSAYFELQHDETKKTMDHGRAKSHRQYRR